MAMAPRFPPWERGRALRRHFAGSRSMRTKRVYRWLLVAFGLGFGAASGCGGKLPVGSMTNPVADGQACTGSDTAKASDGCNICSCSNGTWSCTKETCGGSTTGGSTTGGSTTGGSTTGGSTTCKDGDTKVAADGCNSCSCVGGAWGCTLLGCPTPACKAGETKTVDCNTCGCSSGGQWVCTEKACNPTVCNEGDTKVAPDGCNKCSCLGGMWGCTLLACPIPACKDGETKTVDCNTCGCSMGQWACTAVACPNPAPECKPGDSKKVDCNTCGCSSDGHWACTLLACPAPTCPAPMNSGGACDAVVVWAKDPKSSACCMYGTPCTAPSGWPTFNTQAECEKTPQCPAPVVPDGSLVCPAVEVYAKDPSSAACCQYGDPCRAPMGWQQFTNLADCSK
jgi:hypothetical protein